MISREQAMQHHDQVTHQRVGDKPRIGQIVDVHHTDPNVAWVQFPDALKPALVKLEDLEWVHAH